MKTLTFSFDHPVAVKVFFNCMSDVSIKQPIKFLRSDESGSLTIPVDDCPEGSWEVMLEWNHDGRDFCMQKNFKLKGALLT
ncbi:hypothetical protein [Pedobacter sp. L105]|uniref:hypothetical protein n=1 Tax=Pedobacter sp. L105 TaxID=1641871 RepID=UPI00131CFD33|nr:hypothetical protein [Pedobacter sp. L105]